MTDRQALLLIGWAGLWAGSHPPQSEFKSHRRFLIVSSLDSALVYLGLLLPLEEARSYLPSAV